MSVGHFYDAGGYVNHSDASTLFPVESLSGEVYQYRDAESRLQSVESEKVVVVSPTGLASSYFLTQHPLTAIELESLRNAVRTSVGNNAELAISEFDLIQIGREPSNIQNRSLSEYK
jgi:hypothetical protein